MFSAQDHRSSPAETSVHVRATAFAKSTFAATVDRGDGGDDVEVSSHLLTPPPRQIPVSDLPAAVEAVRRRRCSATSPTGVPVDRGIGALGPPVRPPQQSRWPRRPINPVRRGVETCTTMAVLGRRSVHGGGYASGRFAFWSGGGGHTARFDVVVGAGFTSAADRPRRSRLRPTRGSSGLALGVSATLRRPARSGRSGRTSDRT